MQLNPIQDMNWKAGNVSVGGSNYVMLPNDYRELLIYVHTSDYNNVSYHLPYEIVSTFSTNKIFQIRGQDSALVSLLINSTVYGVVNAYEPDGTDSTANIVAKLYYR